MSATCKAPVGTWDGKTYRISIDGDCHTFAYRTDYFTDAAITAATGMDRAADDLGARRGRSAAHRSS